MVLGGWRLEIDGMSASGPAYRKGRGLLAYLALEEGWHSREKLGQLFAARSPGHLRQLLSNLRATLDLPGTAPSLLSENNLIRLNPDYPLWFDAALLRKSEGAQAADPIAPLERCAELYQGEFLHGLALTDCPDFEEWVEVQRNSLHQHALALLEHLRQACESGGDLARALVHARRLIELDTWNEAGYRQVMRLLALGGQSGAALNQYETCRRLLEKELGVAPEAETQALLAQIRAGQTLAAVPPAAAKPAVAERRLLTVLSCELNLPGEEDIDRIAETLLPARQRGEEIIAAAGGHLLQSLGGRLLAYFGFPLARENAARHALRAALALSRETPAGMTVRFGVHTGMVITSPRPDEPDPAGITTGWAIRLRELAAPGSLVISEPTRSLVDGYFHLRPLGQQVWLDPAKPLAAFQVDGETGADSRLASAERLTPLVGRGAELTQLRSLWRDACRGNHPCLLIRGEAGIGKSRLVRSLGESLAGEALVVLELRCFPEFSHSPFHPILTLLATLFEFGPEDRDETKADKIDAFLRQRPRTIAGVAAGEVLPLLTEALHLNTATATPLDLAPHKQKEKTSAVLLSLLYDLARDLPVLLILEDLHWCDPSTLELLSRHGRQENTVPILTLLTARPSFEWDQGGPPTLELPPLSAAEVTELLGHLSQDLPRETVQRIVAWADGVPLFAEEMARISLLDAASGKAAATPLTLQELLAARLDGTGPAKATAQLAATLGREFSGDLLRRVTLLPAAELAQNLDVLEEAGLVLAQGDDRYQFKHALIQDAAYQSQTRSNRREAHRRIAQTLQQDFPALVDSQPEILAHHLSLAGATAAAIACWLKAGRRAASQSANREAASHFEAGLALLPELADAEARTGLEFALQAALGNMQVAMKGYGSQDARRCFDRAVELSRQVTESSEFFPVMFGLWLGGRSDNFTAAPLEFADRLDHIAQASGDPEHRLVVNYAYGNNLFWLARYKEARHHQEAALAAPASIDSARLIANYGEDSRILSRSFLAWNLWFQGYPDQARQHMAQAVADARELNHAHSLGFALTFAAVLHRHMGYPAETERLGLELAQLAADHDLSLWSASAAVTMGWAQAVQGQEQGLLAIRHSIQAARVAMRVVEATFRSFLVDALVQLGRHEEALSCVEETIVVAATYEDAYLLPEFLRLQAVALLALHPEQKAQAVALLRRAVAVAQDQGALILELRAACDLLQIAAAGDDAPCRELLQSIYRRCDEGFDTPDLRRAAALLETNPASSLALA